MIRKNDMCHNAGSAPTPMEYLRIYRNCNYCIQYYSVCINCITHDTPVLFAVVHVYCNV